jgi:hypothetical protein
MVTFRLTPKEASLDHVRRRFGVDAREVDEEYGLVLIEPQKHLYVAMLDAEAAERVRGQPGVEGVYSNPRIEPIGP